MMKIHGLCAKSHRALPLVFFFVLGQRLLALNPLDTAMGQEIYCPRASDEWLYCESRPGLRQAGKSVPTTGELYYLKQPLPQQLTREGVRVTTDIGTFRYGEKEDQFSSGGWSLANDRTTASAPFHEPPLGAEELKTEIYDAAFEERRTGTPPEWVFIEVDGETESLHWTKTHRTYWVAPKSFDRVSFE